MRFKNITKISQGENPLQAFLCFVKFTMFVSVEQGDITFYWVSVFEKVYLGITTATKTCYQKKKKMKPGTKTVEKCWNFLQLSSFFIFSQFSWISSPPVLEGGFAVITVIFTVFNFLCFLSIRVDGCHESWKISKMLLMVWPTPSPKHVIL